MIQKTLISNILLFIVLFGTVSYASEQADLISGNPKIHSWVPSSTLDLPTDSPSGYVYLYDTRFPIAGVIENCDLAFKQMDTALEHELYYDGPLFGTSFMHCMTDQAEHPLELFVHAGVEPRSKGDIDAFKSYLERIQGRKILGSEIRFSHVNQIIARTDLQATISWDPPPNQAIFHHAQKYNSFSSLGSYYLYQRENRDQFWKPMDVFLNWVEAKWNTGVRKSFQYYALPRVNSITLDYERTYRMDDGSLIKNWLVDVKLFRDCRKNPDPHCL